MYDGLDKQRAIHFIAISVGSSSSTSTTDGDVKTSTF